MSEAIIYSGQGRQKNNMARGWGVAAELGGMAEAAARSTSGAFKPDSAGRNIYKDQPEESPGKGHVVPAPRIVDETA